MCLDLSCVWSYTDCPPKGDAGRALGAAIGDVAASLSLLHPGVPSQVNQRELIADLSGRLG